MLTAEVRLAGGGNKLPCQQLSTADTRAAQPPDAGAEQMIQTYSYSVNHPMLSDLRCITLMRFQPTAETAFFY